MDDKLLERRVARLEKIIAYMLKGTYSSNPEQAVLISQLRAQIRSTEHANS